MDQPQEKSSAVDQQSLTEQLAHYWSGARYEDLPAPVVAMAKSVLLDTLSVGVRGAESTVRQFQKRDVRTLLDAQFSMPYSLAVVAATGRAGLDEFLPPHMDDAKVLALMDRVEIVPDRQLGPYDEPDLEVRGRKGEVWSRHVPLPMGSPGRPIDAENLLRKDQGVAVSVIGQQRFDALREAVMSLETSKDFREVTALLRPKSC